MFKHSNNTQVINSQRQIAKALFRLMETDNYNDLTITEICQEAGVGRKTFYRNFDDKIDVVAFYLYELFQQNFPAKHNDSWQALFTHFSFVNTYQNIFSLLYKNGLLPQIQQWIRFVVHHYQKEIIQMLQDHGFQDYYSYVLNFIASTLYANLELWIKNGYQESPVEMTELTKQFLSGIFSKKEN